MKLTLLLLLLFVAGCATAPPPRPLTGLSCRDFFTALDREVAAAGVRDEGTAQVAAFPYLRVDRFLASFAGEVEQPVRFEAWLTRLGRLDREARRIELANLPDERLARVAPGVDPRAALLAHADACRETLRRSELGESANRRRLRDEALVADDYLTAWRVAGLYPLTALFVRAGVSRWHREVQQSYARPLQQLQSDHTLTSWDPPPGERLSARQVSALLAASRDNPLGIPEPDPAARERLFATFAPQWRIATVDNNDLPGAPQWRASGPEVETGRPTLYRHLSHTRLGGEVLLQLNYVIWFPARPPGEGFDIYAGPLDGINLRVTLGSDGRPLLFDTIHNCGCYHKFFPLPPLLPRRAALELPEPPLVPQLIASAGAVPVLYIGAGAHYVERLDFAPQPGANRYRWGDYQELLSLPLVGGGRRSLFGAHGIVAASARPERLLLWPMGIRSPGAMRQWGRHATAFVGRRHFDDPYLIDTLFRFGAEPLP